MHSMKTHMFKIAAGALAVAALLLLTPRAAKSVAAALVQVTNTIASPAMTQDISKTASQAVLLVIDTTAGTRINTGVTTPVRQVLGGLGGQLSGVAFTVPTGQSFVLTGVDITPTSPSTGTDNVAILPGTVSAPDSSGDPGTWEAYTVSNGVSTQLQFPNGIVFQAGQAVWVSNESISAGAVYVYLHGYLTAN